MAKQWKASPYRYADGVPWNSDRFEVFVLGDDGKWKSVGGAISKWGKTTVAFLCDREKQRTIRTLEDAIDGTEGLCVLEDRLIDALRTLKRTYPDPEAVLAEQQFLVEAAF